MDGMRSSSSLSTSSPSTMYVSSTATAASVRSVSTLSCSSKSVNNNSHGESASSSFEYGRLSPVHVAELASQRLPLILREREVLLENYDKVFAMSWLSDEEILLGTKCNNIILFNARTDKRVVVGQLADSLTWTTEEVQKHLKEQDHQGLKKPIGTSSNVRGFKNETSNSRPLSYASIFSRASAHVSLRAFNAGRRSSTPSGFGSNDLANNLSSLAIRPQTSNIIQYGSGISNNATASRGTVQEQPTWSYAQYSINRHTGGIRSIVVNPSGTMVAIGAGEPYYVTVYSLPEFEPIGMMHGHTDLVFSIKWVSDTVLASASRDGSLRVWSLKSEPVTQIPSFLRPINVWKATTTRSEANVRVRDLAYNRRSGQLMTLNTDGYVKLWDRESYNHLSKIKLTHYVEAVCMAANPYANLYAVGSQAHISILDPRTANTVHIIDSCDEGWGVRALEFKSHIITTGGGYGRLSFYDLRAQRYLDGFVHGPSNKQYLEIGEGWLDRDTAIAGGMAGFPIRNAVYAMQYDDTGTRLFAAGGPLQLDLSGSYAALWS
ncbi:DDB1- and CUL4-associated factor 12 [Actinomortierella wolfii]|nr:DDB1- and CUL4-associated factor 12 [Actinomortierella wolfii]